MAAHHPDSGVHSWTDEPHLYRNKKFLHGFEHLAQAKLSFDAWVYSHQINDVIELAQTFPETPIVLDHVGTPVGLFGQVGKTTGKTEQQRQQIFSQWQIAIAALAECPNVYIKLSGLFMPVLGHTFHQQRQLATKDALIERAVPLIQHVLQCFGTERSMFASNFPMDRVSSSLVNIIDAFSDIVYAHHPDALKTVFYDNAKRFYQL